MAFFVNGLKKETTCLLRVNLDEWSHVAATFDGKTMITYVNGRRADYSTLDPPLQPDEYLQTQGDLSIGAGVVGAEHSAHSAFAEDAADLVGEPAPVEVRGACAAQLLGGRHAPEYKPDRPEGPGRLPVGGRTPHA